MGLWRPKVENDYDKDVYNGDLGIVSRIDLMGPRTTNLRLEAISRKPAAVHRKPQRRRSADALQSTKPIPYLGVGTNDIVGQARGPNRSRDDWSYKAGSVLADVRVRLASRKLPGRAYPNSEV